MKKPALILIATLLAAVVLAWFFLLREQAPAIHAPNTHAPASEKSRP